MFQLSQRPLTASAADQALFVDRERELRLLGRFVELRLHAYVAGPSGVGKTSLLHRLEHLLGRRALYLNAQFVESASGLAAEIAHRARRQFGLEASSRTLPAPMEPLVALDTEGEARVVLLDGVPDDVRHEFFGRHRDSLWEVSALFVVTGRSPRLLPPEDVFFGGTVELDPFPAAVLADMLSKRAAPGGARDDVDRICRALAAVLDVATPRKALAAATSMLLSDDVDGALASLARHGTRAAELTPATRDVLDAVETLGPVHAGDERLLAEVGVTRTRVVQVLQELESKGLVRSTREGRRVLYRSAAVDP